MQAISTFCNLFRVYTLKYTLVYTDQCMVAPFYKPKLQIFVPNLRSNRTIMISSSFDFRIIGSYLSTQT